MIDFLRMMTPFLLASIGGLYTEYSGTTNVAIEGYMTLGAFLVISIYKLTGSLLLAIILTLTVVTIIGFLHSFLTLKLKANPIITGLAINMGFFGLISTLSFKLFNTKGVIPITIERDVRSWIITAIALIIPIITYFLVKYSRYGLRLRAHGVNKKILHYSNIRSGFYFISSMIISSLLSALAGIYLALELRSFIPNISSGRGWISLVIVFLGRKNPFGIIAGCFVFTLTQLLSNKTQGLLLPSELVLAMPYFLTLIALILTQRKPKQN